MEVPVLGTEYFNPTKGFVVPKDELSINIRMKIDRSHFPRDLSIRDLLDSMKDELENFGVDVQIEVDGVKFTQD